MDLDLLPSPAADRRRSWIDAIGAALIVLAGLLATLDSFLEFEHEMIPLLLGLVLLLLNHARRSPIRLAYVLLLLLSMRLFLQGDERYFGWEITLSDYVMIVLAFVAGFRLPALFWRRLFGLSALLLPVTGGLSLSLQRAREPAERFHAGGLSVNQTAFLFGACLTLSLAFLVPALARLRAGGDGAQTPRGRAGTAVALWSAATLANGFLVLQTLSRAGLGIPVLSLVLVGLVIGRPHLLAALDAALLQRFPGRDPRRLRWFVGLGLLAVLLLVVVLVLRRVYADPENVLSDMNRLALLRCYFGVPFTGNNRFLYGMGFATASQTICQNAGPLQNITHAHNILAQLAADNGIFAMLCLLFVLVLLLRSARRLTALPLRASALAALALAFYCLVFLLIEGGWGKVTFLQALIGLAFSSLTMEVLRPVAAPVAAPMDRQAAATLPEA